MFQRGKSGLSAGQIAGIVIGAVIGALILIGVSFFAGDRYGRSKNPPIIPPTLGQFKDPAAEEIGAK